MSKTERRPLTNKEQMHLTRLLWRTTPEQLAEILGVNRCTLRNWIAGQVAWPVEHIAPMMKLTRETVPPKPKRPKPTASMKMGTTPSFFYRRT